MRDGHRAWLGAVAIGVGVVCVAPSAVAAETPDPAMLEFLGAAARLEASGVDVDRLVSERLAQDVRLDATEQEVNDESKGADK